MIKGCLMKMALQWMFRHKTRYILSWISFALVSTFLIAAYSLSAGITNGVQDYITSDATRNQIHIQNMRLEDSGVVNDLTSENVNDMAETLGAIDMRVLYDIPYSLNNISGKDMGDYTKKIRGFDSAFTFLMKNDKKDGTIIIGSIDTMKENTVIVTGAFVKKTGYDNTGIIGKEVEFEAEEGKSVTYIVAAVVDNLSKGSYLNEAEIYICLDVDTKETLIPTVCSFDFSDTTDMNEISRIVSEYGYPYSTLKINTERMTVVAKSYENVTTIIGVIFFVICTMCLINSMMITISENSAFMELFRLMGLTRGNYRFFTCFLSALQGLIGAALGVVLAVSTKKMIVMVLEKLNLSGLSILEEFEIDYSVCGRVVVICVIVSAIVGLLSFSVATKERAETIADGELI